MTTRPKIYPAGRPETLVEQRVTYTIAVDDRFYLIEQVPAQVDLETGERYFSPQTLERLRQIVRGTHPPIRTMETPVYDFAEWS